MLLFVIHDCALSMSRGSVGMEDAMPPAESERFVRVPTSFLEALMQARLSGGQYRVLLWVIRQTYGWNRQRTSFTWYGIAQQIGMHRPAAYRAGQTLLKVGILIMQDGHLALQPDCGFWGGGLRTFTSVADRQLWMPGIDVAAKQRRPLPGRHASVPRKQPERSLEATLFRPAKDIKDRSKTYIKTHRTNDSRHRVGNTGKTEQRHSAGAAKPIPGKYERLSQD
jgi:phage replication O-like protein O